MMTNRGVLLVLVNPHDPSDDERYLDWYQRYHIPEALEIFEFSRGRQYRHSGAAVARKASEHGTDAVAPYITVYEIEDLDPTAKMQAAVAQLATATPSPTLATTIATVYRQTGGPGPDAVPLADGHEATAIALRFGDRPAKSPAPPAVAGRRELIRASPDEQLIPSQADKAPDRSALTIDHLTTFASTATGDWHYGLIFDSAR
jgi:hypothetical protein